MHKERSAGVVVFYQQEDIIQFLLLHYPSGHWDFAKGHVEGNETDEQAALRELKEETGLSATLLPNFKESIGYIYTTKQKELAHKEVIFFVGRSTTKEVTLSYEHQGYAWTTYEQALNLITYQNAKDILKKAQQFLTNYLNRKDHDEQ